MIDPKRGRQELEVLSPNSRHHFLAYSCGKDTKVPGCPYYSDVASIGGEEGGQPQNTFHEASGCTKVKDMMAWPCFGLCFKKLTIFLLDLICLALECRSCPSTPALPAA